MSVTNTSSFKIQESRIQTTMDEESPVSKRCKLILLILNCMTLAIGNCGGPLILRLYFLKGGKSVWFSSWCQTSGWPLILIPLTISYLMRRGEKKLILMKRRVFFACVVIGILNGLDNYIYASGVQRLPVSTYSLIIASQLGFTAVFAFFLVKQKFTPFSINAVVLMMMGAGVLAMNGSEDKPEGVSTKEYIYGFIMTIGAAVLYGLILPLVELMYLKAEQSISYTLVLEIQMVLSFFATVFCTIGMAINNDFKALPMEAKNYELGEGKYYLVLVWIAILWQCFFMGAVGVIFCASSLFSGVMIAVLLPVTEILALLFYKEKFQAAKGVSLILSLWGFVSYFYGEQLQSKKDEKIKSQLQNGVQEREMNTLEP